MYIIDIILDVPLYHAFSYTHNQALPIGTRVAVNFRNKLVIGFVLQCQQQDKPDNKTLKAINQVFNEKINSEILQLLDFASRYYHYPLGQSLFCAIPPALKSTQEIPSKSKKAKAVTKIPPAALLELNQEQQKVVNTLNKQLDTYSVNILFGITGSGKTEVYLELINQVINSGKQVLVLVPEINLTPQLVERFKQRFPNINIAIATSKSTNNERYNVYTDAQNGVAQIIIGTRLAIFTPFAKLGIIIIDEEHDQSYKQQDSFRYHARDLAVWRAKYNNIPIILGSATPSFESLYNYKLGKYNLYELKTRAVLNSQLPQLRLVDLNIEAINNDLSSIVLDEIEKRLALKEMSMVFINRRGFSPIIRCYHCGWVSSCSNCSVNLVFHHLDNEQRCHKCGQKKPVPVTCPKCNSQYLQTLGSGTQKIETILRTHFATARILRIDQDTLKTKKAFNEFYQQIKNNEVDILVGTQILTKGHDFHNLTLVAGLNIDNGLFSYDFRSSEHLYTQLTQVAGRAGRGDKKGLVLLQTNYPKHELYNYLQKNDFPGFANYALKIRKDLNLPPYANYAVLRVSGSSKQKINAYMDKIYLIFKKLALQGVSVSPVIPSVIERLNGKDRMQILISSTNRSSLQLFLDKIIIVLTQQHKIPSGLSWYLDVDALEI
jgi:primosomal protein N' (replication factor Y)